MTPWNTKRIGPAPHIAVDHMGSGDLVVFLHGIGGNKRNWHPNLAAFGQHWHAVAWDARGYGESDDYDGPLDFLDYSRDLARVLDHFQAAQAHIVGLSMGGPDRARFCRALSRAAADADALRHASRLRPFLGSGPARIRPPAQGAAGAGRNAEGHRRAGGEIAVRAERHA